MCSSDLVGGRLQQNGRFADTRITAHQNRRARDQAAAQHTVEFVDAGGPAGRLLFRAFQRHELNPPTLGGGQALGRIVGQGFFAQRIPAAACFALARPLKGDGTAVGADKLGLGFSQKAIPIGILIRPKIYRVFLP